MGKRSGAGENAGMHDDEAQSIRTVPSNLEACSPRVREASEQVETNGPLPDPVGCTILKKSSEAQRLEHDEGSLCSTGVSHTDPVSNRLNDCPYDDFSHSGCRTVVGGRGASLSIMSEDSAGIG